MCLWNRPQPHPEEICCGLHSFQTWCQQTQLTLKLQVMCQANFFFFGGCRAGWRGSQKFRHTDIKLNCKITKRKKKSGDIGCNVFVLLLLLAVNFQRLSQPIICLRLSLYSSNPLLSHQLTFSFTTTTALISALPQGLLLASPNISILPTRYSQSLHWTRQSGLAGFIPKTSNMLRSSDVLVPDPFLLGHSQREAQHFHLCLLQLCCLRSVPQCRCHFQTTLLLSC